MFGEEVLLWMCALRQSTTRPPPDHVHRQANFLLDEVRASKLAEELPSQSVDDGLFAVAALFDEMAMALPNLRQLWASRPLQATRWTTNNAGVEFFERLERVRQGPKCVLATYVVVLGLGFLGRFGLPGAERYSLAQLAETSRFSSALTPTATGRQASFDEQTPFLRRNPGGSPSGWGALLCRSSSSALLQSSRSPLAGTWDEPLHLPRLPPLTPLSCARTPRILDGIYAVPWYLVVGNPGADARRCFTASGSPGTARPVLHVGLHNNCAPIG